MTRLLFGFLIMLSGQLVVAQEGGVYHPFSSGVEQCPGQVIEKSKAGFEKFFNDYSKLLKEDPKSQCVTISFLNMSAFMKHLMLTGNEAMYAQFFQTLTDRFVRAVEQETQAGLQCAEYASRREAQIKGLNLCQSDYLLMIYVRANRGHLDIFRQSENLGDYLEESAAALGGPVALMSLAAFFSRSVKKKLSKVAKQLAKAIRRPKTVVITSGRTGAGVAVASGGGAEAEKEEGEEASVEVTVDVTKFPDPLLYLDRSFMTSASWGERTHWQKTELVADKIVGLGRTSSISAMNLVLAFALVVPESWFRWAHPDWKKDIEQNLSAPDDFAFEASTAEATDDSMESFAVDGSLQEWSRPEFSTLAEGNRDFVVTMLIAIFPYIWAENLTERLINRKWPVKKNPAPTQYQCRLQLQQEQRTLAKPYSKVFLWSQHKVENLYHLLKPSSLASAFGRDARINFAIGASKIVTGIAAGTLTLLGFEATVGQWHERRMYDQNIAEGEGWVDQAKTEISAIDSNDLSLIYDKSKDLVDVATLEFVRLYTGGRIHSLLEERGKFESAMMCSALRYAHSWVYNWRDRRTDRIEGKLAGKFVSFKKEVSKIFSNQSFTQQFDKGVGMLEDTKAFVSNLGLPDYSMSLLDPIDAELAYLQHFSNEGRFIETMQARAESVPKEYAQYMDKIRTARKAKVNETLGELSDQQWLDFYEARAYFLDQRQRLEMNEGLTVDCGFLNLESFVMGYLNLKPYREHTPCRIPHPDVDRKLCVGN